MFEKNLSMSWNINIRAGPVLAPTERFIDRTEEFDRVSLSILCISLICTYKTQFIYFFDCWWGPKHMSWSTTKEFRATFPILHACQETWWWIANPLGCIILPKVLGYIDCPSKVRFFIRKYLNKRFIQKNAKDCPHMYFIQT